MTAMANQTPKALESLKFYVVTKSWFVRAWPILTAKPHDALEDAILGDDLREHIGKIRNSELVLVHLKINQTNAEEKDNDDEKGVGSADETNINGADANSNGNGNGNPQEYDIDQSKQNISEYYRRISENPETVTMKLGLVHTRDYFFLGPSAWMLVKEKFGFDGYEIARCCKKVTPQNVGQSRIEISLLSGEETNVNGNEVGESNITNNLVSTLVPLSGRFPYEKVFSEENDIGACTNTLKSRKAAFLNKVSWREGVHALQYHSLYKRRVFMRSHTIFSLSKTELPFQSNGGRGGFFATYFTPSSINNKLSGDEQRPFWSSSLSSIEDGP